MDSLNLLTYWRNSLADAELINLGQGNNPFQLSFEWFTDGILAAENLQYLRDYVFEHFRQNNKGLDRKDLPKIIPLLASPLILQRCSVHGLPNATSPSLLAPLSIRCSFNLETGVFLQPGVSRSYIINRAYLLPTDEQLAFGNLSDFDDYISAHPIPPEAAWKDFLDYPFTCYRKVTGHTITDPLKGYSVVKKGTTNYQLVHLFVNDQDGSNMSRNLMKLYDYLLANTVRPDIFANLNPHKSLPKTVCLPPGHVGQMNNKFALSASQRKATGHFLDMPEDRVLALNGPPGTGKTTYLQTLVANLFVESAVQGKEPPLIVASSTNNQAVTNIITSFGAVGFVERWLPDLNSFGLYMTSAQRGNVSSYVTLTNPKGEGSIAGYLNQDYLDRAGMHFLQACSVKLGIKLDSIGEARKCLHDNLTSLQGTYRHLTGLYDARSASQEEYSRAYKYISFYQDYTPGCLTFESEIILEELSKATELFRQAEELETSYLQHMDSEPFLLSIFSFLPPVKKRIALRNEIFLRVWKIQNVESMSWKELADHNFIKELLRNRTIALYTDKQKSQKHLDAVQDLIELEQAFQNSCKDLGISADLEKIDDDLDVTFRATMFELATHYWEARWLEDLDVWLRMERGKQSGMGAQNVLFRYHMFAKLFPCFVATAYTLPRFFEYYVSRTETVPFLRGIDLLIVDEAGQTLPEVGGPLFSLCKRAVVVGDTLQIEPVVSLTPGVDRANIEAYAKVTSTGFPDQLRATAGSIMTMAQMLSEHTYDGEHPGLILTEHRRCVPEIIGYCNELAYGGVLEPKRPSSTDLIFPAMGYGHVKGLCEQVGGSRRNTVEAMAIAEWLSFNAETIEARYNKMISDCVGIVTPFKAQERLIREQLTSMGLPANKITIGTVHALQGAEREIVIFSTVYDKQSSPSFINEKPNMLNVAVSRAKDCFLVFGNMEMIKNCPPMSPLGLLGKYLLRNADNELAGVMGRFLLNGEILQEVERISGNLEQDALLRRSFLESKERLDIVSPFLTAAGVNEVKDCICEAIQRGVRVTIWTGQQCVSKQTPESKKQRIKDLRSDGARVYICRNIHSKEIYIDDICAIMSSCNWLSFQRGAGKNNETSSVIRTQQVSEIIACGRQEYEQMIMD